MVTSNYLILYVIFPPLRPNHFSTFDLDFFLSSICHSFCSVISSFFSKIFHEFIDGALELLFLFLYHLLFAMFNQFELNYSVSHCYSLFDLCNVKKKAG